MIRFATETAYALATASVLLAASPASACGGCFAPTGPVTVVTAHRMALSISETETTLWDQIQYAGAPEDFVWVLPVRSGAVVELASNELFGYLESVTSPRLSVSATAWPGCSGPTDCPCCAGVDPRPAPTGVVTVHHEATIGPYET